jgi:hypothetical protein
MDNPTDKPSLPVTIYEVKGRDLPRAWAERANIGPDDTVSVTITADRQKRADDLRRVMNEVSSRLRAQGFRPEDILEAIPDFPLELLRD